MTIDSTPPPQGPEPASNFTASTTDTGIRLSWTHSPSEDVAGYRLYWNGGSGEINYSQPYATVLYPASTYTLTTLPAAGTYRFGLRAVDRDGVEELNTTVTAEILVESFSVTVAVGAGPFDRGQAVVISGGVQMPVGASVSNIPVQLGIRSASVSRTFTVYTSSQGEYSYSFSPLAGEAGSYTVEATVIRNGLRRSATTNFQILGLWLQPSALALELSMNATRTIDLTVSNVGDVLLTGLQYQVEDLSPTDPLTASVSAGLPDSLAPGARVTVPLLLTSAAGDAPVAPAQVQLRVTSAEGSVETSTLTVTLRNAEAEPVIEPQPLTIGVRPGETVTRTVTVTNGGYAAIGSATLALREAASTPWIQVLSGELGGLEPQQAKEVQLRVAPPADLPLGVHFVNLDLNYDGRVKSASAKVEIVAAETRSVAATVYDDTGSVVPGAEVNLISQAFYVSTAPDGSTQEYNNVFEGKDQRSRPVDAQRRAGR